MIERFGSVSMWMCPFLCAKNPYSFFRLTKAVVDDDMVVVETMIQETGKTIGSWL